MALTPAFWAGRKVLLTGHTGFKGSWFLLLLEHLGAEVTGIALAPPTQPAMFDLIGGAARCAHHVADIRDAAAVSAIFAAAAPEIVFHLAAQPLVRASYAQPLETYATNVMGTAHVLEACRATGSVRSIVAITTDKCYENDGRSTGYAETDRLGGHDPYSSSKACAELVCAAWRDSFLAATPVGLATARAGNVIGGGDYAADRLVPDAVRAFLARQPLEIRHPMAVRPWQHVLEPLVGYLMLAEKLHADARHFSRGWNFGPAPEDMAQVQTVIDAFAKLWGAEHGWQAQAGEHPHEAALLTLDSSAAAQEINWHPALSLMEALDFCSTWYRGVADGADAVRLTQQQIASYLARIAGR